MSDRVDKSHEGHIGTLYALLATLRAKVSRIAGGGGSDVDHHYEPLTNSDPSDPQLVFDGFGDVIMVKVPH